MARGGVTVGYVGGGGGGSTGRHDVRLAMATHRLSNVSVKFYYFNNFAVMRT